VKPGSQPTLTVEELKAIVEETTGWQRKWRVSVQRNWTAAGADGGCDSIEHGLEITDAQIAQMQRQGTWYARHFRPYYDDWAPADTLEGKRDRARAMVHETSFRKALKAHLKMFMERTWGGIPWTGTDGARV